MLRGHHCSSLRDQTHDRRPARTPHRGNPHSSAVRTPTRAGLARLMHVTEGSRRRSSGTAGRMERRLSRSSTRERGRRLRPLALGRAVGHNRAVATTPSLALVGREEELARLEAFVVQLGAGPRAFLVRGEPGIGKTALWREARYRCGARRSPRARHALRGGGDADPARRGLGSRRPGIRGRRGLAGGAAAPRARCRARARDGRTGAPGPARAAACARGGASRAGSGAPPPPGRRRRAVARRRVRAHALVCTETRGGGADRRSRHAARRCTMRTILSGSRPASMRVRTRRSRSGRSVWTRCSAWCGNASTSGSRGRSSPRCMPRRVAIRCSRSSSPGLHGARTPSWRSLTMPSSLQELVRDRVRALPEGTRPLLELVAVIERPTLPLVARALGGVSATEALVDDAVAAGAIAVGADGVLRFTHPLLAAAVYSEISTGKGRALHLQVAGPRRRSGGASTPSLARDVRG